jgi:CDGSH-type Zn-finger protein
MSNNQHTTKDTKISQFKVTVSKDGPYIVSGGVPLAAQVIILDKDGECLEWLETRRYPEQKRYSLCRCGQSKNKPFCDGTHLETGFNGGRDCQPSILSRPVREIQRSNTGLNGCQVFMRGCWILRPCNRHLEANPSLRRSQSPTNSHRGGLQLSLRKIDAPGQSGQANRAGPGAIHWNHGGIQRPVYRTDLGQRRYPD